MVPAGGLLLLQQHPLQLLRGSPLLQQQLLLQQLRGKMGSCCCLASVLIPPWQHRVHLLLEGTVLQEGTVLHLVLHVLLCWGRLAQVLAGWDWAQGQPHLPAPALLLLLVAAAVLLLRLAVLLIAGLLQARGCLLLAQQWQCLVLYLHLRVLLQLLLLAAAVLDPPGGLLARQWQCLVLHLRLRVLLVWARLKALPVAAPADC